MGLRKNKIMKKVLEEKDNEFKSKSLTSFAKIVHWICMHSMFPCAGTFLGSDWLWSADHLLPMKEDPSLSTPFDHQSYDQDHQTHQDNLLCTLWDIDDLGF